MKNEYRHNPDGSTTIFIESRKYGTKEALIDTDDFEKLSKEYPNAWTLNTKKNIQRLFYAQTTILHPDGGVYTNPRNGRSRKRQLTLKLHHAIMGKPAKGCVTDHINGNGLDNRRENLRLVTHTENNHNKRKYATNTHGYVGIIRKTTKKKQVRWSTGFGTTGNGNKIYLGTFSTKEEAAQAYDLAVVEHRKIVDPKRQLNFPEKLEEYKALLATKSKGEDKKYKKQ